ncbi:MFS transporter [Parvularcula marina]|uniref:MFS transporter n=1 Tax=Parvularcula marina TaxID=2292771 RepID=A0A371RFB4_9PROT|nr:MFS transporter [Parvularcula marina]RFB04151.1 MFS transporter [Parvularcula marina]
MARIRSLIPLLLATALLLSANGMQNTILALRAIETGFSDLIVGLLYSFYFLGFIGGCRFAPGFIARVGHVRAFTAFASIASAATLAYSLFDYAGLWLPLRIVSGFCMASLYMILESWLNELSTNETRGRVLSAYRITDFTTVTLAQASVGLFNPLAFPVFIVMSIAVSVSLVPVALTRVTQPDVPATAKLDLKKLWKLSPLAAATAVGVGLSASAFWGLGPVFVTEAGYEKGTVGLFMAAIILGGAVAQWPFGMLSDKLDRRHVLIGCAIGGMVTALLLPLVAGIGQTALIIAGAAFGVFALPNFGLAAAHANDHAEPGTYVQVNGGLLMLYGIAAVLGPTLVPLLIGPFGANVIFIWVGIVYAVLVAFSFYRLTQRASPTQQEPYVPMPRTTPAVYEMDPRSEEDDEKPGTPAAETPA